MHVAVESRHYVIKSDSKELWHSYYFHGNPFPQVVFLALPSLHYDNILSNSNNFINVRVCKIIFWIVLRDLSAYTQSEFVLSVSRVSSDVRSVN